MKLSKPKSSVGSRDLNILSLVTGLVHDSVTSETLIGLLLPVVSRKVSFSTFFPLLYVTAKMSCEQVGFLDFSDFRILILSCLVYFEVLIAFAASCINVLTTQTQQ